jgi:hypothetical protein
MSNSTPIPKLDSVHSGVPARLSIEADAAKKRLYSIQTLPNSTPRRSSLRLPPNTSREKFDTAIGALVEVLG